MAAEATSADPRLLRSAAAVTHAIETVGDAWSWLILRDAIFDGVGRFDEWQARLGIARSTLAGRLVRLTEGGLLVKAPHPGDPAHSRYTLTEMGWDFFPCLMTAMRWGDDWAAEGGDRPRALLHTDCEARLDAELVCGACRVPVHAKQVRVWQVDSTFTPARVRPSRTRARTPELSLLERRRPCSIARTLKVIGDRWSSLVQRSSFLGIKRFDDFHRDLGIAESILSQRLTRLVDLGVLTRRAYQANPPRDEYVLTDKGLALYPVYLSMLAWGDQWLASDEDPGMVLEHKPCGHSVEPVVVCAACQGAVRADNITAGPLPARARTALHKTPR